MVFDKNKFKGIVILKGYNLASVATWLGINLTTLYRKIARNGDFSRKEITLISEKLALTQDEINEIFFGV